MVFHIRLLTILLITIFPVLLPAQIFLDDQDFSRQDTLRGSVTPERAWWEVVHYDLSVTVDPSDSTISGTNIVTYRVFETNDRLQIELQQPMQITRVKQGERSLSSDREDAVWFITLLEAQESGALKTLEIDFEGMPVVAARPPWDGGFTWKRDSNGKPFIANANQGIGASVWWPNRDHPADEPDSMDIRVTVPAGLTAVANGRLMDISEESGWSIWHWKVTNPINNYGVNVNVGDYVHFEQTYAGEAGPLDMDFWVLRENEIKARKQFADAPRTIEALEYWFGPYPFYEDSYKLVEVPYLGMEHQSSVTYGNGYQNGYLGRDLSRTGWGLKFDFIIVHETGHEWFANNITYADKSFMWIHESFTHYSEALFVEYFYGKDAGAEYVRGVRRMILNDRPMIGPFGVNREGSSDVYYKGANMLHTLRQIVHDDSLWRDILRGLNQEFRHQTVQSEQIEGFIAEKSGLDLTSFFDQYLRDIRIPVLEYEFRDGALSYRWSNVIPGFSMPVDVLVDGAPVRLQADTRWKSMKTFTDELVVSPDYYVGSNNLLK